QANHNACQPVTTDLLRGAYLFAHGFERAQAFRPTFLNDLPAAAERQRPRRHVTGDHRAGADIGPIADLDRRDQRRVRADEGALANVGAVFAHAVVVAGNGAGPDIRPLTHPRVADI